MPRLRAKQADATESALALLHENDRKAELRGPNAALVQAIADLLAAYVALYKVQPSSELLRPAENALASLLRPPRMHT
jgi:hypothetical protein